MKKNAVALILLSILCELSHAQQSASTMKMDASQTKKSSFHLLADLSVSSNLYKENTTQSEQSTSLDLIPSVDLNDRFKLGARSVITQNRVKGQQRDTTLSNTQINLGIKGPDLTDRISSNGLVRGVAPTNQEDRKNSRYQGAGALGGSLTYTGGIVTLKNTLLGQRNFHEYTVNAEGSPNVQYSVTDELALDLQISKNWIFSTSGYYKQGWTYRDFSRQTYGFTAGIGYEVAKSWSVGVGFENEGNAFKANGTDSNIKFYDENTSVIKASVTFTN